MEESILDILNTRLGELCDKTHTPARVYDSEVLQCVRECLPKYSSISDDSILGNASILAYTFEVIPRVFRICTVDRIEDGKNTLMLVLLKDDNAVVGKEINYNNYILKVVNVGTYSVPYAKLPTFEYQGIVSKGDHLGEKEI